MGESLGSLPAEGEEAALRMSIDRCPLRPLTDLGSHSLAVGVSVVCNSLRSTRLRVIVDSRLPGFVLPVSRAHDLRRKLN